MPNYRVICTCGRSIPIIAIKAQTPEEASEKLNADMHSHWSKKHRDEDDELMPEVEDMLEEVS